MKFRKSKNKRIKFDVLTCDYSMFHIQVSCLWRNWIVVFDQLTGLQRLLSHTIFEKRIIPTKKWKCTVLSYTYIYICMMDVNSNFCGGGLNFFQGGLTQQTKKPCFEEISEKNYRRSKEFWSNSVNFKK